MNTNGSLLLIGLVLLMVTTVAFLAFVLTKKENNKRLVQKCRGIRAPEGSSFNFLAISKTRTGIIIHGFITTGMNDGGPVVTIAIDNPVRLSNNLKIVLSDGRYELLDLGNRVCYQ